MSFQGIIFNIFSVKYQPAIDRLPVNLYLQSSLQEKSSVRNRHYIVSCPQPQKIR
jgi:hypothetical protein